MKVNKIGKLITIIALVLAIAGCSNAKESNPQAGDSKSGGELRVAFNAQPPTMDPLMTTAAATKYAGRHIFESLMTLNSKYQPEPMLAESFEKSEDGKTYTFHLRKGIKFHNGKEMTAEDVVASMDRWKQKSGTAKTLGEISFAAKGNDTVLLQLKAPSAAALTILATQTQFAAVMPKEVIEAAKETGVSEIIGTGPFKFVEWKKDQYIHLTKYNEYKAVNAPADGLAGKKEALVGDLYFDIVTNASTRETGLQTGQYDIAAALPHDSYERLKGTSNVKVITETNVALSIYFNKKQGVFTDVKERKAVNAALDADKILMAAFSNKELYKLNYQYMPHDFWVTEAGKQEYNQKDPEKAKRFLQEAGYNGQEIRLATTQDYPYVYNAAVVIKEQLEQVGMKVKLDVSDFASYSTKREDPTKWDMLVVSDLFRATPGELGILQPQNYGWTDDPKIASSLQAINAAASPAEMKKLWDELHGYIWDYLPGVKLANFAFFDATTDKVQGYKPFDGMIFWNTKVLK